MTIQGHWRSSISGLVKDNYSNFWPYLWSFQICSDRKRWKSSFSTTPLLFVLPLRKKRQQISHKTLYRRKLEYVRYILPLIVWVYLHSNLRGWLRNTRIYAIVRVTAVQGHPRSLISVTIKSVYAASGLLVNNSNFGPNLHRFGYTITSNPKLQVFSNLCH